MTSPFRRVWINEDNAHFYDQHPLEDMSVAGLERLVDTYCDGTRVAGVLFCANVQRALFDSRVWEPLYHGYDPDGGPDQPQFAFLAPKGRELVADQRGRYWVHALWLLKQRGIDHLAVWLARCRHHGVQGWLSMRMNDCHHNPAEEALWHPTLWKTRRDLRRAPDRDEGWFEGAFDYGQPEVVAHHLALVEELCGRYDLDGLELDWNRWVLHFRPGWEEANAHILTEFMRAARRLTDAAAKRLGHPVQLGVRLPATPSACLQLGYDLPTWAREGLVDQIALSSFFEQTYYDWPLRHWQALFGNRVRLLCQPEVAMRPFPDSTWNDRVLDYQFHYGSAASAYQRGADGIYLFNDCYRESDPPGGLADRFPRVFDHLRHTLGDPAATRNLPRRQVVSYAQVVGPGEPSGATLPRPLVKPAEAWEFGRYGAFITLRIPLGGKPVGGSVRLELGFDADTPVLSTESVGVTINHALLAATRSRPPLSPCIRPAVVAQTLSWDVPPDVLHDDTNVVEFMPSPVPGRLVWAELAVLAIPQGNAVECGAC